ncbi:WhiB family transcriptional regulator [Streptomyces sp. WL006]|uniref:WhiB family transcriptional regulator n=1 Tax=Streptomyces sp. WL006 TaxID=3423915 RepID=UPI003F6ABD9E
MSPFPRRAERAPDNLAKPRHWSADAECKGEVTEAFYPAPGQSSAYAKAICWRCPVRVECLTHALEWPETWGVFGGLDEKERRELIADARRLAAKQRERESSDAAS